MTKIEFLTDELIVFMIICIMCNALLKTNFEFSKNMSLGTHLRTLLN